MAETRSVVIRRRELGFTRFLRITEIVTNKHTITPAVAEKTFYMKVKRTRLSPKIVYHGEQSCEGHREIKQEHGIKYTNQHRAYIVRPTGDVWCAFVLSTVRFEHKSFVGFGDNMLFHKKEVKHKHKEAQ